MAAVAHALRLSVCMCVVVQARRGSVLVVHRDERTKARPRSSCSARHSRLEKNRGGWIERPLEHMPLAACRVCRRRGNWGDRAARRAGGGAPLSFVDVRRIESCTERRARCWLAGDFRVEPPPPYA